IPHQMPRRKRPRIVLVVDVSFSVARAAGLFLMMALEFLRPPRRASVWLFVDRPVEATGAVRRWLRRAPSVLRGAAHDPAGPGRGRAGGRAIQPSSATWPTATSQSRRPISRDWLTGSRWFSAPSEILRAEPMKVIPGALVDFFSDGEIVAGVVLSEEKGRLR